MIKPKDMLKLTVLGPKSMMKETIEVLYNTGVVHIEEHTKKNEQDVFDIGEPLESNEKYAELLVKLRAIISNLNVQKKLMKPSMTSMDIIDKKTNELFSQVNDFLRKKEYFSNVAKVYKLKNVEKCLSFKLEENKDLDYSSMVYFVGFAYAEPEAVRDRVEKITNKCEMQASKFEGVSVIALFADNKSKEKIESVLEEFDFSPIDNPVIKKSYELKSKTGQRFVKINHEADVVLKKLGKVETEILELKKEHADFLIATERKLKMETDKAESPLKFATSKNIFLIKGWVPLKNSKFLEKKLNDATSSRVMLKFEKPKKGDNVPIAFNHPKVVEPFEAFMDLYTLPSYKEIDPTFFMFLTFPIFFGFMLGDVGYGLVTLMLFYFLRKKMPGMKNFINAFIIASLVSIVFGMAFGEYFGFEEVSPQLGRMLNIHPEKINIHGVSEIIYPIPHIFSRSHGINELLSISVVFGMVHIILGFVIGFINIYNAHGLKHAFLEKAGWFFVMPIVLWLLVDFLKVITGFVADMLRPLVLPPLVGGILAIAGIIIITLGEGFRGIVELPALISNILSYGRLMAVGLASLSMALVVNDMAGQMFRSGIFGIFAGTLLLVLGHGINIALGILSPFLHSLRLHYVEFFTKFFHGGGKKFKAFGE